MKKGFCVAILLVIALSAASFSMTIEEQIEKLENEITVLEKRLETTRNNVQRTRIQNTIRGHRAKVEELKRELPPPEAGERVTLEILKVEIVEGVPATEAGASTTLSLKGGLAGGAMLFAADYMVPYGAVKVGGELGYALGNGFGVLDLGARGVYSFGGPFAGLELSYAGYSTDVTGVPGLSGKVGSGVGIGVFGGTRIESFVLSGGYNTALGLRFDVGYLMEM